MSELYQIEEYIRRRDYTDYIMPLWLPFLPLLLIIGSTFWLIIIMDFYERHEYYNHRYLMDVYTDMVELYLLVIIIITLIGVIINVYVVYKWVWRRNEHFKRQKLLFNAIKEFLRKKGFDVGKLELICMEIDVEENEKNPVLWALIQFIPYVGSILLIYVYHFLNKDFYRHEVRENNYLSALSEILSDFYYVRYNNIPDRSTILYFVLSLVTFGIFGLYWVYTLTKDPNNHFLEHKRWEDFLLNTLKRI